jgi:hypothetical protein
MYHLTWLGCCLGSLCMPASRKVLNKWLLLVLARKQEMLGSKAKREPVGFLFLRFFHRGDKGLECKVIC